MQVAGESFERAPDDRPEYPAMVGQFVSLAADFDDPVSPEMTRDLERLAASIECIDRTVDGTADAVERLAAWTRMLAVLDGDRVSDGGELDRASLELRDLAIAHRVLTRVSRIMRKESRVAETMRQTTDTNTYVECTVREGRLGAALTLVLVGSNARFRRFFYRLGGPANVIDKIVDLQADRRAGEIEIRPSLGVYLRLVATLFGSLPSLLSCHPGWVRVIRMGVRWLRLLGSSPERLGRP